MSQDVVPADEVAEPGRWWHGARMKLLIEPSSAVPLACVLANPQRFRGRRVGIILSGGNVDPAMAGQWFSSSDHAA